jgi:hypothetical protein
MVRPVNDGPHHVLDGGAPSSKADSRAAYVGLRAPTRGVEGAIPRVEFAGVADTPSRLGTKPPMRHYNAANK